MTPEQLADALNRASMADGVHRWRAEARHVPTDRGTGPAGGVELRLEPFVAVGSLDVWGEFVGPSGHITARHRLADLLHRVAADIGGEHWSPR